MSVQSLEQKISCGKNTTTESGENSFQISEEPSRYVSDLQGYNAKTSKQTNIIILLVSLVFFFLAKLLSTGIFAISLTFLLYIIHICQLDLSSKYITCHKQ